MNTHANKTQENKSQSVANGVSHVQSGGEPTFQFVDNRAEVVAQRRFQKLSNQSQQIVIPVKQLHTITNNRSSQQNDKITRKSADNHVEAKNIQRKVVDGVTNYDDANIVYDLIFDDDFLDVFIDKGFEAIRDNIVSFIEHVKGGEDSWSFHDIEEYVKDNALKGDFFVAVDEGEAYGGNKGFFGYPKDKDQTKAGPWGNLTLHNDAEGCLDHAHGFDMAGVSNYGAGTGKVYDFNTHNEGKLGVVASRAVHFRWANELAAKKGETHGAGNSPPANCTWHHKKQHGQIQLLDRQLHATFRHKGGYSIWGS